MNGKYRIKYNLVDKNQKSKIWKIAANTKFKRKWFSFRSILYTAILAVGFWFIFLPNFLSVRNFKILSNDNDLRLEVENFLKNKYQRSDFFKNKNLIFIRPKSLETELLQKIPQLKDVLAVKKDYPNTITVSVTKKNPRFFVQNDEGVVWLLDENFLVFKKQNFLPSSTYPNFKIQLPTSTNVQISKNLLNEYPSTRFIRKFSSILEKDFPNEKVVYFLTDKKSYELKLFFKNFYVFLNSNDDPDPSLKKIEGIVRDVPDPNSINYIDLTINQKAFVCLNGQKCQK